MVVWLPTVTSLGAMPIIENTNTELGEGTLIVKLPSMSEGTPLVVPFSRTLAPGRAVPSEAVTLPETLLSCACA